MRELCAKCQQRPAAVNYYKEGKPFYRSKCDHCSKGRKKEKPQWATSGYQKKTVCDRCNFTSKHQEQFNVLYIDGNLKNNKYTNLKTVCANCQRIISKLKLPWRQGDLKPDF